MEWLGNVLAGLTLIGAITGVYSILNSRVSVLEVRMQYLEDALDDSISELKMRLNAVNAELKLITGKSDDQMYYLRILVDREKDKKKAD